MWTIGTAVKRDVQPIMSFLPLLLQHTSRSSLSAAVSTETRQGLRGTSSTTCRKDGHSVNAALKPHAMQPTALKAHTMQPTALKPHAMQPTALKAHAMQSTAAPSSQCENSKLKMMGADIQIANFSHQFKTATVPAQATPTSGSKTESVVTESSCT